MISINRRRYRWLIMLAIVAAFSSTMTGQAFALKERGMVEKVLTSAQASVVNAGWMQLYMREMPYNASNVANTANYSITSADDPDFATPVVPILVHNRYFPEDGPYSDTLTSANVAHLNEIYRIYLKLPASKKLKEGKTYTVTVDPAVVSVDPLTTTFDPAAPNEVIHVNQVGYITDGPKVAYLSWWTGQGSVSFADSPSFQVIDESTGAAVYAGSVQFEEAGADEKWGKSDLYSLDFSSFNAEGRYHLYIPGVGSSYSFAIASSIYKDEIGYTLMRGLTMQRDGDHGLDDPAVTHWNRPAAHLDDAIDEATGQRVDLTGGHMDAGDRGKYPLNVAATVSTMLLSADLFPDQVAAQGESLEIPESGNGIPDYLDELAYELDFLYKVVMNTSKDGAIAAYIHPASDGYEQGTPPEGQTGRIYFDVTHGPLKAETLYGAGALAMAYNSPLMQHYFPEKMDGYRQAALRAFGAFETHKDDASFWKPEDDHFTDEGPHTWSDEMLIAAANLHQMTGDAKYADWIASELPAAPLGSAQKKWGWVNEGPWTEAFLSLYKDTHLSETLRQAAHDAILDWADTAMSASHDQPYGVPMVDDTYSQVGWYFSGSQVAFPMMLAYGVSHDEKYRDQIVKTWNYLLGSGPLSNSYISGLGDPQRSPHWLTHEISQYEWTQYKAGNGGWKEMVPGIPNADLQDGKFPSYFNDAWNSARVNNEYPALGDYPALYRYTDTWNTTNEFVTLIATRDAVSVLPLIPTTLHTLTTSAEHGKISPSGGSYTDGTALSLSVTPDLGYRFTGWSGDASGTDNPLGVTMDANKSITANFAAVPTHMLTGSGEHGHLALDPAGGVYNEGAEVTVRAVPDSGYRFAGWSGDLTGADNPAVITMDADKTIVAHYEEASSYTLDVNADGGRVLQSPQKAAYEQGEQVVLEALPDSGYVFAGWSGDLTGTQNPAAITMDGNKSVTAGFSPIPTHRLTLDATEGGTVSPASGDYAEGGTVTLTAAAQPGYVFTGWSGDLTGMANPADITMDADKTITAHFQSASSVISQDIFTANAGTTTVDENGVYTLHGSGYNFWSAPDAMHYTYEMGLTGNFSMIARLDSMTVENPNGMAGIQIRTNTADNAAYANIFVQDGQLVGRFRKGGDYSDNVASRPVTLPVWMKISRGPNPWSIATYYSEDGENWTPFTSGDFWAWQDANSPELTAGLFVVGGTDDQYNKYTTAQFGQVVWPVDPANAANPVIALDQADGAVTHNPYTVSGSVTHAQSVQLQVNGGAAQSAPVNAGMFSAQATLAPGDNTITVTADAGDGRTDVKMLHVTYDEPFQTAAHRISAAPNVDGQLDDPAWAGALADSTTRSIQDATLPGDSNNTLTYGLLWDDAYLYVGAEVADDAVISGKDAFGNDGVEVYVDMANGRSGWDNAKDSQLAVGPGDDFVTSWRISDGVIAKSVVTDTGYTAEMAIPWSAFGVSPSPDMKLGFDIGANDDDTGSGRTGVIMWSGTMDNWKQADGYGEAALSAESVQDTTPPVIEITAPENKLYADSDELTPQFAASDAMAGIDTGLTAVTLDGQAVPQGMPISLYALPLGEHELTVSATDLAGNTTQQTVRFRTGASIDSLKALVARFADEGKINNGGIENSLMKQLEHASVGSFVSHVQAQKGKHIDAAAATILLRDANAL